MQKMNRSDLIREYARREYVDPARRRGEAVVEIVAGDVHRGLHLRNLAPNVCQALSGRRFLEENGLLIERREGPPSGLSTSVKFVYRMADRPAMAGAGAHPLLGLRGIAKGVFRDLGGGEAFIRAERENFYGAAREH